MDELLIVSSSPHIRSGENINKIMRDVVIALLPATLFGIYNFGIRALLIVLISIASSVGTEYAYQKLTKKAVTINDLSAVVTGLLIGMNLAHTVPLWLPIMGSVFAIIIVKQLFGGLGQNFMNPALAARVFLSVSYAKLMTNWELDAVSTATPLALINSPEGYSEMPALMDAFIGNIAGCIGETSAIALLIGGIYLLVRRVISWRIPVAYLGTVAVMVILFGGKGFDLTYLGYHLFSGGLMLGAFFMATDYSSSPSTKVGRLIMGVGCGMLTVLIRLFGVYPEGVSFSIIIMNLFVPLIDRYTLPKAFGEVSK